MNPAGCPKHMEYGPCGGVGLDGACEVSPQPCCFLDAPTVRWAAQPAVAGHTDAAGRMRTRLATGAVVVADLPAAPMDARSIRDAADALGGRVDAVLAGDSGSQRVQFPPAYRAHLIRAAGLLPWAGLNCRDRNRVALEGELAGLADAGAAAVHCVTGDHTDTGSRPDAMAVFDLDSTRLAALARREGHLVSVGESPATPPVARRAARLAEKVRAGAEICFVNHAGGAEPVRRFVDAVAAEGHPPPLGYIPCVPIVLDRASAELVASFPALVLPEGYLDAVLAAPDPRAAGIRAAVELGRAFLELDGVVGVNLSGGGAPDQAARFADAMGEIGAALHSP